MRSLRGRRTVTMMLVSIAVCLAGCSSTGASKGSGTTPTTLYSTTLQAPEPAGKNPSAISIEVCSDTAQSQNPACTRSFCRRLDPDVVE